MDSGQGVAGAIPEFESGRVAPFAIPRRGLGRHSPLGRIKGHFDNFEGSQQLIRDADLPGTKTAHHDSLEFQDRHRGDDLRKGRGKGVEESIPGWLPEQHGAQGGGVDDHQRFPDSV